MNYYYYFAQSKITIYSRESGQLVTIATVFHFIWNHLPLARTSCAFYYRFVSR
jgi:hypothetical protein